jgi:hypothetical protein
METALVFIHTAMPVIYAAVLVAGIVKFIMVARYKEPDFVVFLMSFFKIYSQANLNAMGVKRRRYMLANNIINFFFYFAVLLFVLMLITYGGDVFKYS